MAWTIVHKAMRGMNPGGCSRNRMQATLLASGHPSDTASRSEHHSQNVQMETAVVGPWQG